MHIEEWRQGVIADASEWIGTPYHHKGRKKGVGVDCGGLIYEVYRKYVIGMRPFPQDYAPDWCMHQGQEIYEEFIGPYTSQVVHPVPAGISLFRVGRCFGHGAIWTGEHYIHAWGRNGFSNVMKSYPAFFRGKACKHFDVRAEWLKQ